MRPTRDEWAMSMAKITALRATCLRRQVGCVLLNARGHVLATGVNGVASGLPHCDEMLPGHELKTYGLRGSDPSLNEISLAHLVRSAPELFPHACHGHDAPSGQSLDACQPHRDPRVERAAPDGFDGAEQNQPPVQNRDR